MHTCIVNSWVIGLSFVVFLQFLQQRKLQHTSMLTNFNMEIKNELAIRMGSLEVQNRLQWDAYCRWNKHHEQLKDSILKECDKMVASCQELDYELYNNEEFYSMKMKAALDMRTLSMLKFDYWLNNHSVQARLLVDIPLKASFQRYVYPLSMMCLSAFKDVPSCSNATFLFAQFRPVYLLSDCGAHWD